MYGICQTLNKANLDMFWYWVMGVTDQYVHSKITNDYYEIELESITQSHFEVKDLKKIAGNDDQIEFEEE